jgi:hypothetical protein
MRNVLFIGQAGCKACERMYETVIAPLEKRYPNNISTHYKWDGAIERVNRRKTIKRIPLVVVEKDGREEFRYCGELTIDELSAIVECERETLTLDDVLGGAR